LAAKAVMSLNDFAKYLNEVAEKWLKKWYEDGVFNADPEAGKPKFFITAAFPYPNSPLHIGHARTYTVTDIYARFKRMQGYNVLYPMGFHYTGTPILTMAEAVAKGDRELIDLFINVYNIPKEDIEKLKTPLDMARYFHEDAKNAMKQLGLSIDWRREFTSITPQFSQFIRWQFQKLKEKGYVTQGTHPVGWCPVHQNPVGQHDTKGDVEPEIGEFTLILFEGDSGEKYPCATLRPETVFGVTNLWVNPKSEYVLVEVDGSKWIVSSKAAWKLMFQNRSVKIIKKMQGRELLGKRVKNPMTGSKVPILPGEFVDPNNASGVVMSVPAHAPYDYVALEEIRGRKELLKEYGVNPEELKPISIIHIEGFSELPARDIVVKMNIKSQLDKKLEEATKQLYSLEYHKGIMKENTGKYSRLSAREAREKVKEDLISQGKADVMYEILNKPVYCRCGTEIVVKILENQWFLDYSNSEWKELARKALKAMKIFPEEFRKDFEYTIEWVKERACARQRGLGTELPWSPGWIIESLSDSTIYMAYYTISKYINQYNIEPGELTHEVFDYVFLGIGDVEEVSRKSGIPSKILKAMREEFLYWYPLDSRHSAKDLVPNHLTFFIYNHAAIFPEKLWPKQIVVNGFVLYEGKKMSKSLRNIVPLRIANKIYGPDVVRLALAVSAEINQDADFSVSLATSILERLRRIKSYVDVFVKNYRIDKVEEDIVYKLLNKLTYIDKWLLSIAQSRIREVTEALENLRMREASGTALYLMEQDLKWYLEMSENPSPYVLKYFISVWVRMLAPFAPFISEELWRIIGKKEYVSLAKWPKYDEKLRNFKVELAELYLRKISDDIREIVKVTSIKPSRIYLYTAASWKYEVVKVVIEKLKAKVENPQKEILREVMKNRKIAKHGKKVVEIVKSLIDFITPLSKEYYDTIVSLNEEEVLRENIQYLKKILKVKDILIMGEEKAHYDPKGKAKYAVPWKPAIYIE